MVHVTPAHQFPLGVTMSLPRRLTLLEHAASRGGARSSRPNDDGDCARTVQEQRDIVLETAVRALLK